MIGKNRFHFGDIASTQDKARELAQNNCVEGAVVIAERQSGGRGKPGSSWFSPDGGVYLSVVLKPYKSPADTSIFTLLASQAVINTIKKVSGRKASIKAPNDVLLEGKKICGILIERITCSGTPVLIVGIGINLNMNEFSPDLESTATSLSLECERSFDKKIFMDTLLDELDHEYSKFLANRI